MPRPSQELNILQEAARSAVVTEMAGMRADVVAQLSALRGEIRDDFAIAFKRIEDLAQSLHDQSTATALLQQRIQLKEEAEENARQLAALQARRDTTPLYNHRHDKPSTDAYRAPDPPWISPKIVKAVILAIAAGAGGTIWHYVEHAIWPRDTSPTTAEMFPVPPAVPLVPLVTPASPTPPIPH
jgi:hypothetical protein